MSNVVKWFSLVESRYGFRGERVGEASHPGPEDSPEATTVPASSWALREADRGEWSATVLSFGGVQPVAMDAGDEDDAQSVLHALERDLSSDKDSVEARSTASEGPNDSEREDAGSEAASDDLPPAELEPDPPLMRPSAAAMRAGLPQLDMVDLSQVFARRAAVMKGVPRFLWGSFRIALKLALEEIAAGSVANDRLRQERGWKLFLVLPRMLLHRPPRGGLLGKDKLLDRFQKFSAGQWADLLTASENCSEQAAVVSRRRGRRQESGLDKRVSRALHLVQLGELSSGETGFGGCRFGPWHNGHSQRVEGSSEAPPKTTRGDPRDSTP